MVALLIIILIVGCWVAWRMTHYNDSKWVKERIVGRSDDQKAVIRYFCNEPGFLWKKPISDAEYDKMIQDFIAKNDFRQRAIDKIGLDESEIQEVEPVHLEGFVFDKNSFSKKGKDDLWRSSKYQISWLFFSATQIYLYQYTANFDEDGKREATEEYFYKDVTNVSTSSDTVETETWDDKQDKFILINVDTFRFAITVPGDKLYCAADPNEYVENSVKGMKSLLREKKNA